MEKDSHYSGKMRAEIGKYAAENGNEKVRKHFLKDFPDLKESTIKPSFHMIDDDRYDRWDCCDC